jgi:hypothetical protein
MRRLGRRRLLQSAGRPFRLAVPLGRQVRVTISVGLALNRATSLPAAPGRPGWATNGGGDDPRTMVAAGHPVTKLA